MKRKHRPAVTRTDVMVVVAILGILALVLVTFVSWSRSTAARMQAQSNLRALAQACQTYQANYEKLPPGNDGNDFSAVSRLWPFIESGNQPGGMDFNKPITDPANAKARKTVARILLSPRDPIHFVSKDYGATNYLFNAGSKPGLKDNDGIFYQDSETDLRRIPDGAEYTVLIGETLKGDGGKAAVDVRRQHVLWDKNKLDQLGDDSGIKDFETNQYIAGDRCASWMDGRFLQGTFTGTRALNDERPDVNCDGAGGLSGLRSLDNMILIVMCDGTVRVIEESMDLEVWKSMTSASDERE